MKPIFLGIILVLLSVSVTEANWELMNPAELVLLNDRELQLSFGLDQGFFINYTEPDYGYGAGGLSWLRLTSGDETITKMTYTVGKAVRDGFAAGIGVRYHTVAVNEDDKKQYVAADLGLLFHQWESFGFGLTAENLIYTGLFGQERDLGIYLRPNIYVKPTTQLQFDIALHDALDSFAEREVRLNGELDLTETLTIIAGLDHGLAYSGSTLHLGAGLSVGNWVINYSLAKGNKTDEDFQHYFGVSTRF